MIFIGFSPPTPSSLFEVCGLRSAFFETPVGLLRSRLLGCHAMHAMFGDIPKKTAAKETRHPSESVKKTLTLIVVFSDIIPGFYCANGLN